CRNRRFAISLFDSKLKKIGYLSSNCKFRIYDVLSYGLSVYQSGEAVDGRFRFLKHPSCFLAGNEESAAVVANFLEGGAALDGFACALRKTPRVDVEGAKARTDAVI